MAETFTIAEAEITLIVGAVSTVKGFAKNFRAVSRNSYYVHQRLDETSDRKEKLKESHELSWAEAFFDVELDSLQLNDTEFSVQVDYDNGTDHYRRTYALCKLESHEESDGEKVMESSVNIYCRTKTATKVT